VRAVFMGAYEDEQARLPVFKVGLSGVHDSKVLVCEVLTSWCCIDRELW